MSHFNHIVNFQCLSYFSHTVNLLINMPRDCYEELLAPLQEGDVADIENKDIEFDGKNMEAIVVLLNFLYKRFDRVSHVQQ